MTGKIIVIEGTDSSGKETQSILLEEKFKAAGKKCIHFSFPMYDTPTGRIVGEAYLGRKELGASYFPEGPQNVDYKVAALYYAADRKYNMNKINKWLEEGYYVILDRYTTSSLAYQGSKIADKDERFNTYQWIDKLEYWLLQLPKPDKTIYLHAPSLTTTSKEKEELLKNAENAYIELSELYNWDRIECVIDNKMRSKEDISAEIYEIVKNM